MGLGAYFTNEFSIQRSQSPDGSWGNESTEIDLPPGKGWLQPNSGKILYQDGKPASQSTHLLYCSIGTDIKALDTLTCETKTYTVGSVQDAAGRAHHLEVDLVELS